MTKLVKFACAAVAVLALSTMASCGDSLYEKCNKDLDNFEKAVDKAKTMEDLAAAADNLGDALAATLGVDKDVLDDDLSWEKYGLTAEEATKLDKRIAEIGEKGQARINDGFSSSSSSSVSSNDVDIDDVDIDDVDKAVEASEKAMKVAKDAADVMNSL